MSDHNTQRTPIVPPAVADAGRRAHYMGLGATLYMPPTRTDLLALLNQEKLTELRSLVVCTEDALHENKLAAALHSLEATLDRLGPAPVLRFVRPRSPAVLERIVRMPGCKALDGVVLPKVDETNVVVYAEATAKAPWLALMPTIETDVAFDRARLERLRAVFVQLGNPVLCLRIGGNDLLQLLGLKRPKHMTVYDTPLRSVIDDLIVTFRPAGFELSSPVFEHLDSAETLEREVALDMVHGLWAKTAIHPSQVGTIQQAYQVSEQDYEMAEKILGHNAPAVFKQNGQMCEPRTHSAWATRILERAKFHGVVGSSMAEPSNLFP